MMRVKMIDSARTQHGIIASGLSVCCYVVPPTRLPKGHLRGSNNTNNIKNT